VRSIYDTDYPTENLKIDLMEPQELERILKSGKKVNVLNFPVGVEIYLHNPYRICNISPNGDWIELGTTLRTRFNRFLAFSKINKLEYLPIGEGDNLLLSDYMKGEYNKIKVNIEKSNAKLIWKIFWFNHLEATYDALPKKADLILADNLTVHSKAVLFHFLAITDSFIIFENKNHQINIDYWEQALKYWKATFDSREFWLDIEKIIDSEKANGNFELRNYNIDELKDELPNSILNSLSFIPLKLIEQNQHEKNGNASNYARAISIFLDLILKSDLGTNPMRMEYAKQLVENYISREVSTGFKTGSLKTMADAGKYRDLYDNGMLLIDRIHKITTSIKNLSKYNDPAFLREIDRIPEIHERVIEPLIEGIESFAVMHIDTASRELIDKTFYTQLILCLRILCELRITPSSRAKLIKNVFDLSSRFSYKKLPNKKLAELNTQSQASKNIINNDLFAKFYMMQYCYFINGEFADPDASVYKIYKTTTGIVSTTHYTFVPRSKLAKEYHDKKITLDNVKRKMQNSTEEKELKEKLKQLKQQTDSLNLKQKQLEQILQEFKNEENIINSSFQQKQNQIEEKIQSEVGILKTKPDFLSKTKPFEMEKKRLEDEKIKCVSKHRLDKKKKKANTETLIGIVLLVAALTYFATSVMFFHFHGIIGLLAFGLMGLFFIGDSDRLKLKIKTLHRSANKEIKKIDELISTEDLKIEMLTNELYPIVKLNFKQELDKNAENYKKQLSELNTKYDAGQQKKNLEDTISDIAIANTETEGINATLKNKNLVKALSDTDKHPIVAITRGY
jgi:hypothetical protein